MAGDRARTGRSRLRAERRGESAAEGPPAVPARRRRVRRSLGKRAAHPGGGPRARWSTLPRGRQRGAGRSPRLVPRGVRAPGRRARGALAAGRSGPRDRPGRRAARDAAHRSGRGRGRRRGSGAGARLLGAPGRAQPRLLVEPPSLGAHAWGRELLDPSRWIHADLGGRAALALAHEPLESRAARARRVRVDRARPAPTEHGRVRLVTGGCPAEVRQGARSGRVVRRGRPDLARRALAVLGPSGRRIPGGVQATATVWWWRVGPSARRASSSCCTSPAERGRAGGQPRGW